MENPHLLFQNFWYNQGEQSEVSQDGQFSTSIIFRNSTGFNFSNICADIFMMKIMKIMNSI